MTVPTGLEYKTAAVDHPDAPGVVGTIMGGRGETSDWAAAWQAKSPEFDLSGDPEGTLWCVVAVTGIRDDVNDVIVPGAPRRTMREREMKGVLGHDWNRPVAVQRKAMELQPGDPRLPDTLADGETPWPREAGVVLVKAAYILGTSDGRDAYEQAKAYGQSQAYSIGYKVTPDGAKIRKGVRYITDLDIYEFSPVLHGANRLATLMAVKGADGTGLETGDGEPAGEVIIVSADGPADLCLDDLWEAERKIALCWDLEAKAADRDEDPDDEDGPTLDESDDGDLEFADPDDDPDDDDDEDDPDDEPGDDDPDEDDEDETKGTYLDLEAEEKGLRRVHDSGFWGVPVGTPIRPGMKPRKPRGRHRTERGPREQPNTSRRARSRQAATALSKRRIGTNTALQFSPGEVREAAHRIGARGGKANAKRKRNLLSHAIVREHVERGTLPGGERLVIEPDRGKHMIRQDDGRLRSARSVERRYRSEQRGRARQARRTIRKEDRGVKRDERRERREFRSDVRAGKRGLRQDARAARREERVAEARRFAKEGRKRKVEKAEARTAKRESSRARIRAERDRLDADASRVSGRRARKVADRVGEDPGREGEHTAGELRAAAAHLSSSDDDKTRSRGRDLAARLDDDLEAGRRTPGRGKPASDRDERDDDEREPDSEPDTDEDQDDQDDAADEPERDEDEHDEDEARRDREDDDDQVRAEDDRLDAERRNRQAADDLERDTAGTVGEEAGRRKARELRGQDPNGSSGSDDDEDDTIYESEEEARAAAAKAKSKPGAGQGKSGEPDGYEYAERWAELPERKAGGVRTVRDSAYWGRPVGTPITPGMKPIGPRYRAGARDRGGPQRSGQRGVAGGMGTAGLGGLRRDTAAAVRARQGSSDPRGGGHDWEASQRAKHAARTGGKQQLRAESVETLESVHRDLEELETGRYTSDEDRAEANRAKGRVATAIDDKLKDEGVERREGETARVALARAKSAGDVDGARDNIAATIKRLEERNNDRTRRHDPTIRERLNNLERISQRTRGIVASDDGRTAAVHLGYRRYGNDVVDAGWAVLDTRTGDILSDGEKEDDVHDFVDAAAERLEEREARDGSSGDDGGEALADVPAGAVRGDPGKQAGGVLPGAVGSGVGGDRESGGGSRGAGAGQRDVPGQGGAADERAAGRGGSGDPGDDLSGAGAGAADGAGRGDGGQSGGDRARRGAAEPGRRASGDGSGADGGEALADPDSDAGVAPDDVTEDDVPDVDTAVAKQIARVPSDADPFRPSGVDDFAPSGARAKLNANMEALRTLRILQKPRIRKVRIKQSMPEHEVEEYATATPEQQAILARWAGWGGLPKVFDDNDPTYAAERAELRGLLSEAEWREAERNTLNAHYTDARVVQSVWQAVQDLGFTGGRVLEPGSGSGTFVGFAPDGADMVGVERDSTTAAISKYLYPGATIRNESFGDTRVPNGAFDAVVGNVPFGKYPVHDPVHNPKGMSIHNHFITKSLALTRPGGVVAVLSSRFTLDAENPAARKEMAKYGDLIGAVRLPTGSHRKTAATDVIEDVLIFRRRGDDEEPGDQSWVTSTKRKVNGFTIPVNDYFTQNPGHVLGDLTAAKGEYGTGDMIVKGDRNFPGLPAVLQSVVERARASGMTATERPDDDPLPDLVSPDSQRREGQIQQENDGSFTQAINGQAVPFELPAGVKAAEFTGLLAIRDAVNDLLQVEARSLEDTPEIVAARAKLNEVYDRYVAKYGPITRYSYSAKTGNRNPRPKAPAAFAKDPQSAVVRALESFDKDTGQAQKASIFIKRSAAPRQLNTTADNPKDALSLSMDTYGEVRLDEIARMLGVDEGEARRKLGTLVHEVPPLSFEEEESAVGAEKLRRDGLDVDDEQAGLGELADVLGSNRGTLEPAAAYLSGNVRRKLAIARAAARRDPRFAPNVAALERVQPADLGPEDIDGRLGAVWIPASDIVAFANEISGTNQFRVRNIGGSWSVEGPKHGVKVTEEWGTDRRPLPELLDHALNQTQIKITTNKEVDEEATTAANEKLVELQERFQAWIWENSDRARRLSADYNDRFNGIALRSYDGATRTFPGMADGFKPKPHQVAAVERIVSEPTALLGHVVGAGKTAEMTMGAAELKRLGMARKPAIIIPNHMLEQFSREYLEVYPNAKILAAGTDDVSGEKRREFVARAATGDWDCVILTQNAFESIPMRGENQASYLEGQLAEMRTALREAELEDGGEGKKPSRSVKDMQKSLESTENALKKLLEKTAKDEGGVTFEDTGIDYLFVDEAHHYSNLRTFSKIQNAGATGAGMATDMHMKLEYLRATTQSGRVATFATGTPIRNTVTQAYIMMKYLRPDLLQEAGINTFDAWAATFGEVVTETEFKPEGEGGKGSPFRQVQRFSKFRNIPELLRIFHTFADIKLADDLKLPTPSLVGGKAENVVVPGSPELRAYIKDLGARAEAVRSGAVKPDEDNMLSVSMDGRKAALSMALVNDAAGNQQEHQPGKIEAAADNIHAIWQQNRDRIFPINPKHPEYGDSPDPGALQIAFLDLGTPKSEADLAKATGPQYDAYEKLRDELVARGMDPKRIRFMHEAKNDQQKAELFAAARTGKIDVLVGSTEKMGVGTNVQARAVALHHLDAPWRPSDVEQRDGRIQRQGNANSEVRILRYVTEGSFDVYMWQTLERKARFINQIMKGSLDAREIEDVGETSMNYAEVKAIATGNESLITKAKTDALRQKLERLQRNHARQQVNLRAEAERLARQSADDEAALEQYDDAIARRRDTAGGKFTMEVNSESRYDDTTTSHSNRNDAGEALATALEGRARDAYYSHRPDALGTIGGFTVIVEPVPSKLEPHVAIRLEGVPGDVTVIPLRNVGEQSGSGLVTRIENFLSSLENRRSMAAERIERNAAEVENIRARVGREFPKARELAAAQAKAARLDAKIKLDSLRKDKELSAEAVRNLPADDPLHWRPEIDTDQDDDPILGRDEAIQPIDTPPSDRDVAIAGGETEREPATRSSREGTSPVGDVDDAGDPAAVGAPVVALNADVLDAAHADATAALADGDRTALVGSLRRLGVPDLDDPSALADQLMVLPDDQQNRLLDQIELANAAPDQRGTVLVHQESRTLLRQTADPDDGDGETAVITADELADGDPPTPPNMSARRRQQLVHLAEDWGAEYGGPRAPGGGGPENAARYIMEGHGEVNGRVDRDEWEWVSAYLGAHPELLAGPVRTQAERRERAQDRTAAADAHLRDARTAFDDDNMGEALAALTRAEMADPARGGRYDAIREQIEDRRSVLVAGAASAEPDGSAGPSPTTSGAMAAPPRPEDLERGTLKRLGISEPGTRAAFANRHAHSLRSGRNQGTIVVTTGTIQVDPNAHPDFPNGSRLFVPDDGSAPYAISNDATARNAVRLDDQGRPFPIADQQEQGRVADQQAAVSTPTPTSTRARTNRINAAVGRVEGGEGGAGTQQLKQGTRHFVLAREGDEDAVMDAVRALGWPGMAVNVTGDSHERVGGVNASYPVTRNTPDDMPRSRWVRIEVRVPNTGADGLPVTQFDERGPTRGFDIDGESTDTGTGVPAADAAMPAPRLGDPGVDRIDMIAWARQASPDELRSQHDALADAPDPTLGSQAKVDRDDYVQTVEKFLRQSGVDDFSPIPTRAAATSYDSDHVVPAASEPDDTLAPDDIADALTPDAPPADPGDVRAEFAGQSMNALDAASTAGLQDMLATMREQGITSPADPRIATQAARLEAIGEESRRRKNPEPTGDLATDVLERIRAHRYATDPAGYTGDMPDNSTSLAAWLRRIADPDNPNDPAEQIRLAYDQLRNSSGRVAGRFDKEARERVERVGSDAARRYAETLRAGARILDEIGDEQGQTGYWVGARDRTGNMYSQSGKDLQTQLRDRADASEAAADAADGASVITPADLESLRDPDATGEPRIERVTGRTRLPFPNNRAGRGARRAAQLLGWNPDDDGTHVDNIASDRQEAVDLLGQARNVRERNDAQALIDAIDRVSQMGQGEPEPGAPASDPDRGTLRVGNQVNYSLIVRQVADYQRDQNLRQLTDGELTAVEQQAGARGGIADSVRVERIRRGRTPEQLREQAQRDEDRARDNARQFSGGTVRPRDLRTAQQLRDRADDYEDRDAAGIGRTDFEALPFGRRTSGPETIGAVRPATEREQERAQTGRRDTRGTSDVPVTIPDNRAGGFTPAPGTPDGGRPEPGTDRVTTPTPDIGATGTMSQLDALSDEEFGREYTDATARLRAARENDPQRAGDAYRQAKMRADVLERERRRRDAEREQARASAAAEGSSGDQAAIERGERRRLYAEFDGEGWSVSPNLTSRGEYRLWKSGKGTREVSPTHGDLRFFTVTEDRPTSISIGGKVGDELRIVLNDARQNPDDDPFELGGYVAGSGRNRSLIVGDIGHLLHEIDEQIELNESLLEQGGGDRAMHRARLKMMRDLSIKIRNQGTLNRAQTPPRLRDFSEQADAEQRRLDDNRATSLRLERDTIADDLDGADLEADTPDVPAVEPIDDSTEPDGAVAGRDAAGAALGDDDYQTVLRLTAGIDVRTDPEQAGERIASGRLRQGRSIGQSDADFRAEAARYRDMARRLDQYQADNPTTDYGDDARMWRSTLNAAADSLDEAMGPDPDAPAEGSERIANALADLEVGTRSKRGDEMLARYSLDKPIDADDMSDEALEGTSDDQLTGIADEHADDLGTLAERGYGPGTPQFDSRVAYIRAIERVEEGRRAGTHEYVDPDAPTPPPPVEPGAARLVLGPAPDNARPGFPEGDELSPYGLEALERAQQDRRGDIRGYEDEGRVQFDATTVFDVADPDDLGAYLDERIDEYGAGDPRARGFMELRSRLRRADRGPAATDPDQPSLFDDETPDAGEPAGYVDEDGFYNGTVEGPGMWDGSDGAPPAPAVDQGDPADLDGFRLDEGTGDDSVIPAGDVADAFDDGAGVPDEHFELFYSLVDDLGAERNAASIAAAMDDETRAGVADIASRRAADDPDDRNARRALEVLASAATPATGDDGFTPEELDDLDATIARDAEATREESRRQMEALAARGAGRAPGTDEAEAAVERIHSGGNGETWFDEIAALEDQQTRRIALSRLGRDQLEAMLDVAMISDNRAVRDDIIARYTQVDRRLGERAYAAAESRDIVAEQRARDAAEAAPGDAGGAGGEAVLESGEQFPSVAPGRGFPTIDGTMSRTMLERFLRDEVSSSAGRDRPAEQRTALIAVLNNLDADPAAAPEPMVPAEENPQRVAAALDAFADEIGDHPGGRRAADIARGMAEKLRTGTGHADRARFADIRDRVNGSYFNANRRDDLVAALRDGGSADPDADADAIYAPVTSIGGGRRHEEILDRLNPSTGFGTVAASPFSADAAEQARTSTDPGVIAQSRGWTVVRPPALGGWARLERTDPGTGRGRRRTPDRQSTMVMVAPDGRLMTGHDRDMPAGQEIPADALPDYLDQMQGRPGALTTASDRDEVLRQVLERREQEAPEPETPDAPDVDEAPEPDAPEPVDEVPEPEPARVAPEAQRTPAQPATSSAAEDITIPRVDGPQETLLADLDDDSGASLDGRTVTVTDPDRFDAWLNEQIEAVDSGANPRRTENRKRRRAAVRLQTSLEEARDERDEPGDDEAEQDAPEPESAPESTRDEPADDVGGAATSGDGGEAPAESAEDEPADEPEENPDALPMRDLFADEVPAPADDDSEPEEAEPEETEPADEDAEPAEDEAEIPAEDVDEAFADEGTDETAPAGDEAAEPEPFDDEAAPDAAPEDFLAPDLADQDGAPEETVPEAGPEDGPPASMADQDGAPDDAAVPEPAAPDGPPEPPAGGADDDGTISADMLAEAQAAEADALGLIEADDGELEVTEEVAQRQTRVEGLLRRQASGELDLSGESETDLRSGRRDVVDELRLQEALQRRENQRKREQRAQRAEQPAPESQMPVEPLETGEPEESAEVTPPEPTEQTPPAPERRPGLAGAVEDLADAVESGDAARIDGAAARARSSLARSRGDSDEHAEIGAMLDALRDGGDVDAGRMRELAEALKAAARARRNESARNRRTAKRLERERLRSLLGQYDAELRNRGQRPEEFGGPAPAATSADDGGTGDRSPPVGADAPDGGAGEPSSDEGGAGQGDGRTARGGQDRAGSDEGEGEPEPSAIPTRFDRSDPDGPAGQARTTALVDGLLSQPWRLVGAPARAFAGMDTADRERHEQAARAAFADVLDQFGPMVRRRTNEQHDEAQRRARARARRSKEPPVGDPAVATFTNLLTREQKVAFFEAMRAAMRDYKDRAEGGRRHRGGAGQGE